jgi:hypothetical protein
MAGLAYRCYVHEFGEKVDSAAGHEGAACREVQATNFAGEPLLDRRSEFAFLACLARELDHFVPYADLKRAVFRDTGSDDQMEEATFCQGLKSRIKKKWVPKMTGSSRPRTRRTDTGSGDTQNCRLRIVSSG